MMALAVVGAAAQHKGTEAPKTIEGVPGEVVPLGTYAPPYATTAHAPAPAGEQPTESETLYRTSGEPDAGLTGRADTTLRAAFEQPGKLMPGATYLFEGLRVRRASRVKGTDRLFAVAVGEPRTGAGTSSYLDTADGAINFVFVGEKLRAMLDADPNLARFPARVRCQWRAIDTEDGQLYGAYIFSVEWLDDDGRIVAIARTDQ